MKEDNEFPSEFQKRTLWRAVTGLAILILGALLVSLIWLTSNILGYLQPVLVPLAAAGIVAYLLDPVVKRLQKKGLSRIKGIVTVFSGFLIFFGILFFLAFFSFFNFSPVYCSTISLIQMYFEAIKHSHFQFYKYLIKN